MPKIYKLFFSISVILMFVSLVLFLLFGLNLGVDFSGGSILEIKFLEKPPENEKIKEVMAQFNLSQISITSTEDKGLILKMPQISEEIHQKILEEFKKFGSFEEKRFDSIGSILGKELKRKSITAIIIGLILISFYLAIVFRKIGGIINPFVLALGAIIALFHDLFLPLGVFVVIGKLKGMQIDAPLIAAALTILGYSINDTVVVYDRIRENVIKLKNSGLKFQEIVHQSIKQTLVRSINTTLTTLFAIIAIYIFGGETLKNFTLALIIGIASGAYSSVFVASPILMLMHKKRAVSGLR